MCGNKFRKLKPMKDIIETKQIESGNSSFLIDLIKHGSGSLYVEILQILHEKEEHDFRQIIKINPTVLPDIIKVLQKYLMAVPNEQLDRKQRLSEASLEKIQHHYLIGVPIEDLTIQFNCSSKLIEDVLRSRGIAIVPNEIPKTKNRQKR